MVNDSSIELYDYLYKLFYNVVSKNVYCMDVPQELTDSDVQDGFLVVHVGSINDRSEFARETYGMVRCYVEAYVPPISRGRLNINKFDEFERGINDVIKNAAKQTGGIYGVQEEGVLSSGVMDADYQNNAFHVFFKSFLVSIDVPQESPVHFGDLFIGMGGDTLTSREDIENLDNVQYFDKQNPAGEYEADVSSTSYLWICTTGVVHDVSSSGFAVPMSNPIRIDDMLCYRSVNSIIQGTMNFTII